jgi:SAM-dependent MidA family methyltransferase
VFGRCLASQSAEVLEAIGGGDILEIGAGTGALAEDILNALAEINCLPEHYWILETSPDLRDRQRDRLARLPPLLNDKIQWIDRPPEEGWSGVLIANEVMDALPVARLRGSDSGLHEIGVTCSAGELREVARPASATLKSLIQQRDIALEEGQEAEVCPSLPGWISSVTASLTRGVVLLMDYGESRQRLYTHDRRRGTLVAFHRHRQHTDPYINLGLQDLTAWVDFTAVAEAAVASELTVEGYTTQSCFLLANGFEQHLARVRDALDSAREPLAARSAMRLVLPNDMGECFKCIALSRAYSEDLRGFSLRDFTDQL